MRDWGPKMLVFPDLGSQVEVAQKFDPETPRRPWNNTMYPEKGEWSIVFTHLYGPRVSTVPKWRGMDLRSRKGGARKKLTSGPKAPLYFQGLKGTLRRTSLLMAG
jgi:hypothetical protein